LRSLEDDRPAPLQRWRHSVGAVGADAVRLQFSHCRDWRILDRASVDRCV